MSTPDVIQEEATVHAGGPEHSELRAVFRHLLRNRAAVAGMVIIAAFLIAAVFAPIIATHSPTDTSLTARLKPPGDGHILGTDELGRDLFSRMLYGGRISLGIGIISVAIGAGIGVPLGALSGYYGGKFDILMQRFIDIMIAFPGILLAIVVVTVLGVGVENVMIATGIASVPIYARLVRGSVLAAKEQSYVAAARAAGIGNGSIIFRHILPNCLGPIIVLEYGAARRRHSLWNRGSSFLGLGDSGAGAGVGGDDQPTGGTSICTFAPPDDLPGVSRRVPVPDDARVQPAWATVCATHFDPTRRGCHRIDGTHYGAGAGAGNPDNLQIEFQHPTAASSAPSTTSPSRSTRVRSSASSVRAGAARPPSHSVFCSSFRHRRRRSTAGRSSSTDATSSISSRRSCGASGATRSR
jgi:peptide/nickel transport system permease protein